MRRNFHKERPRDKEESASSAVQSIRIIRHCSFDDVGLSKVSNYRRCPTVLKRVTKKSVGLFIKDAGVSLSKADIHVRDRLIEKRLN